MHPLDSKVYFYLSNIVTNLEEKEYGMGTEMFEHLVGPRTDLKKEKKICIRKYAGEKG